METMGRRGPPDDSDGGEASRALCVDGHADDGAYGLLLCDQQNRVGLCLAVIVSRGAFRFRRLLDGQCGHRDRAAPSSRTHPRAACRSRGALSNGGRLSLRTISAGESSILTFINPLLVVVFATLFLGARYQRTHWVGV